MFVRLLVGLSLALLGGCVTQTTHDYEPRYTSSTITIAEPGFKPRIGDRLAWHGPAEVISDGSYTLEQSTLDHLRHRFEARLQEQGFEIVGSQNRAEYLISTAVILGEPISEGELVSRFDVAPAMNNTGQYNAGTIVVRLLNPVGNRTRWRGAMEVFTDPDQSEDARLARIDHAVDSFARQLAPVETSTN